MKTFAFISALILLTSCQENDDLVYQIYGVGFSATKLHSNDGLPFTIEDSINGSHFGFRINWNVESNNAPYDPVETSVRVLNPILEFKITSDKTIAGIPPGNPLNSLFYIYYAEDLDEVQLPGYLNYITESKDHFSHIESSFLKAKTQISAGNYDFYFRSKFSEGAIVFDTIKNVKIK